MNTAAKLLTSNESPNQFHALHIIFVRMLATSILGMSYMWYKRVPDFPLGPRHILGLLVLRGTFGFIGLFGLYCELLYLFASLSRAGYIDMDADGSSPQTRFPTWRSRMPLPSPS